MSHASVSGGPGRARDVLVEKAVRRFQMQRSSRSGEARPAPRVITITRQLGGGGRPIAEHLGDATGLPVYDREVLELLAAQSHAHLSASMFEALDERARGEIEDIVAEICGGVDQHRYFCLLPRAILTLSQTDCIILGRGAHLLLPNALKIQVEASIETRIRNMQDYEGLSAQAAREQIADSDRSRDRFIRHLMQRIPERSRWFKDRVMFDLTLCTDAFTVAQSAEIILAAAEQRFQARLQRQAGQDRVAGAST